MRAVVLAGLLLALLVATPAAAQQPVQGCTRQCSPTDADVNAEFPVEEGPVGVVLYAHFQDILNRAPLNLRPPTAAEGDVKQGFFTPTLATGTGTEADIRFKNNVFTMTPCPGLVDVKNGRWLTGCHSNSFSRNLPLAGPAGTLYWYVSAGHASDVPVTGSEVDTRTSVMPGVGVRAWIVAGRDADEGPRIAAGDTGNAATIVSVVGGETVYEFAVPIQFATPYLPGRDSRGVEDGFVIVTEFYQIRVGNTAEAAQSDWRMRSGPNYPPRLVLHVEHPIEPRGIEVVRHEGDLFVRTSFHPAFGSYDMPKAGIDVRVDGAPGLARDDIELVALRRSMDHDGVHKPVNATWRIPAAALGDRATLTITTRAMNDAGTYQATQSTTYEWTTFDGESVPAPSLLLALVAMLAVLVASRRRSRS